MTREEAKEVFINRGYVNVKGETIFDGDKWRQSVEVITEWLKEQPCDDAISRQEVLDIIDSDWKYEGMEQYINELSSVKPQPKTGHWIEDEYEMKVWCSECGEESDMCSKYCPNCGAKMEVEE